ncbi:MAG: magnesium-translocating P-type ATPase [Actinobacteria bacterium]|nr:magnesium-translocating P-type ATPase [Actinomycetota bacterium]
MNEESVEERVEEFGLNEPAKKKRRNIFLQILIKFSNPLVIVLLIIATSSLFLDNKIGAYLIYLMAVTSVMLTFIQEYRANREAEKLIEMVSSTATVYRDNKVVEIKIKDIVPGDIVYLSAGDMIPADLRIISCKDLFINQSSLTGESFPVEKFPVSGNSESSSITEFENIVFMGTSVVSGTAITLVLETGTKTQFGELSQKIVSTAVETGFDKGIKRYTWLMLRFMVALVLIIFTINAIFKKDILQALFFALAVAIGMAPEMLPMLVAINLSKGTITMSRKKVIVKRLNSIQNFGAMNILCTDKTGTLTLDKVVLERHCDVNGEEDEEVLRFTYLNSFYQTGLRNLLDRAILDHEELGKELERYKKIDEIPFDFSRKIMSVIVEVGGKHILISKGRPEALFERCKRYELDGKISKIDEKIMPALKNQVEKLNSEGFRTVALGYKVIEENKNVYSREDESDLILKGYVAFLDPPKPGVKETIGILKKLGIELKILTGDNTLVTKKICDYVGLEIKGIINGNQIEDLTDKELRTIAQENTIFTRLTPIQKERIIEALQANKNIVGFLGDGINDAPALKVADVGISVNNAVDIAKETADIILLEKSLSVLEDGVVEGRKVFGNIIKYVKMGSSSNFGNMISPTVASIFLPFLPMLPIQILLNNFLYDISQIGIPTDNIDAEYITKPKPWNIDLIKKFMLIFGPVSSVFDLITFGTMLMLHAPQSAFHTAWFLESLTTQTLVIYIIRTPKLPFIKSRPSKILVLTSLLIIGIGYAITYSPIGKNFGFVKLPINYLGIIFMIVIVYLITVQLVKQLFTRKFSFD